jgi:hypothetical protein
MQLNRDDMTLLRLLGISRSGLHIYTIFRKAGLAAPAMSKSLGRLQRDKLVRLNDDVVTLTPEGALWVSENPPLAERVSERLERRKIGNAPPVRQAEFRGPKVEINELYVPRTTELPRSLIKLIAEAEGNG